MGILLTQVPPSKRAKRSRYGSTGSANHSPDIRHWANCRCSDCSRCQSPGRVAITLSTTDEPVWSSLSRRCMLVVTPILMRLSWPRTAYTTLVSGTGFVTVNDYNQLRSPYLTSTCVLITVPAYLFSICVLTSTVKDLSIGTKEGSRAREGAGGFADRPAPRRESVWSLSLPSRGNSDFHRKYTGFPQPGLYTAFSTAVNYPLPSHPSTTIGEHYA